MKILFIGSTLITRICAEKALEHGNDVTGIITLPDNKIYKRSRGVVFDDLADKGVEVLKTDDISSDIAFNFAKEKSPELIVQCGWSQKIPKKIIEIPHKGCIGIHQSYLPQNRGAASLNWALINDMKETGVTLFYMEEGFDDGDIVKQTKIKIDERDDIETLHMKSDTASCELLLQTIDDIKKGTVRRTKQDHSAATYTKRRRPEDGLVKWDSDTLSLNNFVRALCRPFPGAFSFFKNKKIIIWKARPGNGSGSPGEVIRVIPKTGIEVVTGDGSIILERINFDGFDMWADDFAKKHNVSSGDVFG